MSEPSELPERVPCEAAYREFFEAHGHGRVPGDLVTGDGIELGAWVARQRANRLVHDAATLAQLERLPGWEWESYVERWNRHAALYAAFAEENGHGQVPADLVLDDGTELGAWVAEQRAIRLQLSEQLCARLEALPAWTWDSSHEQWSRGVAAYLAFHQEHGHGRVPHGYVAEDGTPLGHWVAEQRRDRWRHLPERYDDLEALPGWEWRAFAPLPER